MSSFTSYGFNSLPGASYTTSGSTGGMNTQLRTYIYGTSSAGTVTYSNQNIVFNTLTINNTYGGSYNTISGVFTATRQGYFNLTYNIDHSGGPSSGNINIKKNGTPFTNANLRFGQGVYVNSLTIPLSVNDTLTVYISGSDTFDMSNSIFCIYEL